MLTSSKYLKCLHTKKLKFLSFKSWYSSVSSFGCDELLLCNKHIPVLASETVSALNVKDHGVYLDMTFGAGGHTRRILESHPNTVVYGLDRDPTAYQLASALQKDYPTRFHPLLGKFSDLAELLFDKGVKKNFFNGILMDLGVSSMQFNTPERGFMLSQNGPLDMRMDGQSSEGTPTAADMLAHINEESLYRVLKYYGQETRAKAIARAIIESRSYFKRLKTTQELAQIVASITGVASNKNTDKLQRFSHPATKTFQALRILVNDELNELDLAIRLAHFFLQPDNGILVSISFHSLEDTILKRHFTGCDLDRNPDTIGLGLRKHRKSHLSVFTTEEIEREVPRPWRSLINHVIIPSKLEIENNPRARSAKLRVACKISCQLYR